MTTTRPPTLIGRLLHEISWNKVFWNSRTTCRSISVRDHV